MYFPGLTMRISSSNALNGSFLKITVLNAAMVTASYVSETVLKILLIITPSNLLCFSTIKY